MISATFAASAISASVAASDLGGEALDAVVGGMDLEDRARLRAKRQAVIFGMGAVGGANLDQLRPRPRHDVRHAERAADLDQLAPRYDSLAAARQRIEAQKHGRRIIVDQRGVLSAGERAEKGPHMVVALAAPARRQVELKRRRLAHGLDGRLDRRLGEDGAAEIGVQHRSGEVEQRTQVRAVFRLQPRQRLQRQLVSAGDGRPAGSQRIARLFKRRANGARRRHAAEALQQRRGCGGTQDGINGWQIAEARRT